MQILFDSASEGLPPDLRPTLIVTGTSALISTPRFMSANYEWGHYPVAPDASAKLRERIVKLDPAGFAPGGRGLFIEWPDRLIVRQSPLIHDRIADLVEPAPGK